MPPEGSLAWVSTGLERRIARRLAFLRAERGWSLDELADRAGISRATLSRIERAKLSPPTAILIHLCGVFGWTLGRIVADAESASPTLIARAQQPLRAQRGSLARRRVVSPPTEGLRVELLEEHIPAGGVVSLERGAASGLERHLWLLAGAVAISVSGTEFQLGAGDCLRWQGAEHAAVRSLGKRGARYLVAIVRS
jgi:transcriptional regulator with XRE-family HTH domain